ncbi:MAG: LysR family transcriptional regulator [Clostridia bacterium]|nr:LysR family transcriptional regulator [Clostridia bacterium]
MDTLKIHAFLSAVKHKSLSKAAEEIDYTPSALSHMADALENELGVQLLKRTPLGVELTSAGKILYDKFVAVVDAEKALLHSAAELTKSQDTELKIGTYWSIAQQLLPEIIKDFKKEYPQIKFSVHVGNDLRGWLQEGIADVIFTDKGGENECEWVEIMPDPFVAVVPSRLFTGRKSIKREELYDYPYIQARDSFLSGYFEETRFQEIIPVNAVDNASVISMVQEGMGVSVLPSLIFRQTYKGVRAVPLKPEISRTLGFSYKKSRFPSQNLMKFIAYLKAQMRLNSF